jgi:regulator of replication initiation timing
MTDTDHTAVETMKTQIAQLLEKNEALQASMETIQQQHEKEGSQHGEMDDPDPQPLSAKIWNALDGK